MRKYIPVRFDDVHDIGFWVYKSEKFQLGFYNVRDSLGCVYIGRGFYNFNESGPTGSESVAVLSLITWKYM